MHIFALLTDAYGGHGGIARYNQALLHAFASSQADSEIVALVRVGQPEAGVLPPRTAQLPPAKSRIAFSARATSLALTGGPFDLVFCGHLNMGPLALAVARIAGAPLWLQLHGVEAWECPSWYVRAAAERADLVTAVSRHTRRRFLEWADITPTRVRVLPNTFEPRFAPGPKPRHLVERMGLDGRRVLLTVSRLAATERYKGHDCVIAALSDVLRQRADVSYVIVGDGDDRARLEGMVNALGVAQAVHFVGDVADRELPDYFRLADCFVMPSIGEGFGIVYLEAAASGVPVVAGILDGSRDALADGALGTLIDPGDKDQLTAAMISALDRPIPPGAPSPERFAFANFSRHVDELIRGILLSRAADISA